MYVVLRVGVHVRDLMAIADSKSEAISLAKVVKSKEIDDYHYIYVAQVPKNEVFSINIDFVDEDNFYLVQ